MVGKKQVPKRQICSTVLPILWNCSRNKSEALHLLGRAASRKWQLQTPHVIWWQARTSPQVQKRRNQTHHPAAAACMVVVGKAGGARKGSEGLQVQSLFQAGRQCSACSSSCLQLSEVSLPWWQRMVTPGKCRVCRHLVAPERCSPESHLTAPPPEWWW